MSEALGALKVERTAVRLSYRSGDYARTLVSRVGQLEVLVFAHRRLDEACPYLILDAHYGGSGGPLHGGVTQPTRPVDNAPHCHSEPPIDGGVPFCLNGDQPLNLTPGPPPLPSIKATPAVSRVLRISAMVRSRGCLAPRSKSTSVLGATFAASARLCRDHPRSARAARHCSGVIAAYCRQKG